MGACVSVEVEGRSRIVVDGERCVLCGACLDACPHEAREFRDDTEQFFRDLKELRLNAKGEGVSLLVAPSFRANYPEEYEAVLGGLKQLGVNRIINVAFGADIANWGYLQYIRTHHLVGGVSQPCPVVVSYIEHYLPELLPKLFPIQSPMMCAAIYARTQLGVTDRFAFIGPCIGKKLEVDDPVLRAKGNIHYNVTFHHLMRYVREHNISGPLTGDGEVEYGVGSFYPAPGGLAESLHWFLGDEVFIREVCGEKRMYQWLHQNAERILSGDTPYLLIDALNCQDGCLGGTGVESHRLDKTDDGMFQLLNIFEGSKREAAGGPSRSTIARRSAWRTTTGNSPT